MSNGQNQFDGTPRLLCATASGATPGAGGVSTFIPNCLVDIDDGFLRDADGVELRFGGGFPSNGWAYECWYLPLMPFDDWYQIPSGTAKGSLNDVFIGEGRTTSNRSHGIGIGNNGSGNPTLFVQSAAGFPPATVKLASVPLPRIGWMSLCVNYTPLSQNEEMQLWINGVQVAVNTTVDNSTDGENYLNRTLWTNQQNLAQTDTDRSGIFGPRFAFHQTVLTPAQIQSSYRHRTVQNLGITGVSTDPISLGVYDLTQTIKTKEDTDDEWVETVSAIPRTNTRPVFTNQNANPGVFLCRDLSGNNRHITLTRTAGRDTYLTSHSFWAS